MPAPAAPLSAPTRPPARPALQQPAPAAPKNRLLEPAKAKPICPKIVLGAVEGFGKTSFVAHAEGAVILQCRENGYDTLLSAGLAPEIPAPTAVDWPDTLEWLDTIGAQRERLGVKVLGLDAMGGLERYCHEFVCKRDFAGDWGERGFASYQKGYDISVGEWLKLLQKLDHLNQLGISIVLLAHTKTKTFKNPLGADFDRYVADVHDKTWAATARWADVVLFGNFYTIVDVEKKAKKGKGIGGTDRVIYTERRDTWDAKNRFGMTPELWLPAGDHKAAWPTVWEEIVRNKATPAQ